MFQAGLLKDRNIVVTGGGTGLGAEMARRVDGLVNNAAGNFLAAAEDLSSNGFKTVVEIVLNGTFHCTSAFGRKMIEAKRGGAILNIVTTYAWTGSAFVLPSACAKAGVLVMTRSLAVEWAAYGIRVNAIAPGPVPTEGAFSRLMADPSMEEQAKNRVPLKRFGTPREIADAAVFLLSDGAAFVTGDCLTVDGGEWLKSGGEFSDATDYDRDNFKQMLKAMRGKEK